VPLLADPVYAEFLEAYGKGGQRALRRGQLHHLARLYWYTVEFGLISTSQGLRIFGAGILSSPGETVFAVEDSSPNRIAFDLERVMRTKYIISDYQQTYFVVESFEQLLQKCYQDFGALYDDLRMQPDIEAQELTPADRILTRGDHHYFEGRGLAAV
jgi:phenylalanine-4-hydroxylase